MTLFNWFKLKRISKLFRLIPLIFLVILGLLTGCTQKNVYKVRQGDSLRSISKKFKIPVNDLAVINGIEDLNYIKVGQQIRLTNYSALENDFQTQSNKTNKQPEKIELRSVYSLDHLKNSDKKGKGQSVKIVQKNNQINKQIPGYQTKQTQSVMTNLQHEKNIRQIPWKKPIPGRLVQFYDPNVPGHKGVQFAGAFGQDVQPAAKGQVVYTGTSSGYGQLVIIKHSANIYSTYSFLSQINVKELDIVRSDQIIGKVGYSKDKRAVLNFEIRVNNKTVNPYPYVK